MLLTFILALLGEICSDVSSQFHQVFASCVSTIMSTIMLIFFTSFFIILSVFGLALWALQVLCLLINIFELNVIRVLRFIAYALYYLLIFIWCLIFYSLYLAYITILLISKATYYAILFSFDVIWPMLSSLYSLVCDFFSKSEFQSSSNAINNNSNSAWNTRTDPVDRQWYNTSSYATKSDESFYSSSNIKSLLFPKSSTQPAKSSYNSAPSNSSYARTANSYSTQDSSNKSSYSSITPSKFMEYTGRTKSDGTPDWRDSVNRRAHDYNTGAKTPTNMDGTLDRRFNVNKGKR